MEGVSLKNLTSRGFGKPVKQNNEFLQKLGKYHIDSFNYMVTNGILHAVNTLIPVYFATSKANIELIIKDASIHPPRIPPGLFGTRTEEIYPMECRQRKVSYSGKLEVILQWSINGKIQPLIRKVIGFIPIMLKSKLCNLQDLTPAELVKHGEHPDEFGGYFIVRGRERIVRMLINSRRNYPMVFKRSSWKNRDKYFSDIGVSIKCISEDHTTVNNVLHYLTDGSAKLMIAYRKNLYFTPVLLIIKCLIDFPDEFIFQHLISGFESDQYFRGCIIEMMRSLHENGIHTQSDAMKYVGQMFRVKIKNDIKLSATNEDVCDFVLRHTVLIHLKNNFDKFRLLVLMMQNLFAAAQNKILLENPDAIMMQELLLGGHLYLQILKEKLQNWMLGIRSNMLKSSKLNAVPTEADILSSMKRMDYVQTSLENFFSTGNLSSTSGLGLKQDKGFTIMLENISRMRYISQFHAVHKGAGFQEMRITEPRQLLPDAWGFICPVHTPDGTPCGLLNHLARECQVTDAIHKDVLSNLVTILVSLGMSPATVSPLPENISSCSYHVQLDGRVIGYVLEPMIKSLVHMLRGLKIEGQIVPNSLEIVLIERKSEIITQFPGLYLFSGNARMVRPVVNIAFGKTELIGTFEQVYLDISISEEEAIQGVTTHYELSKSDFLSYVASLIPLPDYNQSPRNMYQCQMGKQSMGTACHNWQLQCETKLYRLQTPASPLFRPVYYDMLKMDDFAMGLNAVIAVVSYTGYDMEDAMIINKASLERGFAHGSIYKSETIELKSNCYFARDPNKDSLNLTIDADGLPYIGSKIKEGDYYYGYYDEQLQSYLLGKYRGKEDIVIDNVKLCGEFPGFKITSKACIVFRIQRNPTVGDKFASRAGQKGIFSIPWKMEDLPFTESGIVPDIVFNPHGFPSRMTIAMMIECMAGKGAALKGTVYDASPFSFSEDNMAINNFGEILQQCGYNYFGDEVMYSGVDGYEMNASIFFGIVHYQRLRHMVSDKWQVRNTGPIDVITRQPLKGRKRGGGGRVGEMERDALLAHGSPYLLLDRFVDCSDKATANLCSKCKTIIGPTIITQSLDGHTKTEQSRCKICNSTSKTVIGIPYILQYLAAELACNNINLIFHQGE